MANRLPSGAELEAKGLLTFTCDACREAFPRRCNDHPSSAQTPVPPEPPRRVKRAQASPSVLAYGRPFLAYTAPYEALEAEISATMKQAR